MHHDGAALARGKQQAPLACGHGHQIEVRKGLGQAAPSSSRAQEGTPHAQAGGTQPRPSQYRSRNAREGKRAPRRALLAAGYATRCSLLVCQAIVRHPSVEPLRARSGCPARHVPAAPRPKSNPQTPKHPTHRRSAINETHEACPIQEMAETRRGGGAAAAAGRRGPPSGASAPSAAAARRTKRAKRTHQRTARATGGLPGPPVTNTDVHTRTRANLCTAAAEQR